MTDWKNKKYDPNSYGQNESWVDKNLKNSQDDGKRVWQVIGLLAIIAAVIALLGYAALSLLF